MAKDTKPTTAKEPVQLVNEAPEFFARVSCGTLGGSATFMVSGKVNKIKKFMTGAYDRLDVLLKQASTPITDISTKELEQEAERVTVVFEVETSGMSTSFTLNCDKKMIKQNWGEAIRRIEHLAAFDENKK